MSSYPQGRRKGDLCLVGAVLPLAVTANVPLDHPH
jgi:hypothetical protein